MQRQMGDNCSNLPLCVPAYKVGHWQQLFSSSPPEGVFVSCCASSSRSLQLPPRYESAPCTYQKQSVSFIQTSGLKYQRELNQIQQGLSLCSDNLFHSDRLTVSMLYLVTITPYLVTPFHTAHFVISNIPCLSLLNPCCPCRVLVSVYMPRQLQCSSLQAQVCGHINVIGLLLQTADSEKLTQARERVSIYRHRDHLC